MIYVTKFPKALLRYILSLFHRDHLQRMSISGDTDHPFPISFEDVASAAFRIRKGVIKTPCQVILSPIIT